MNTMQDIFTKVATHLLTQNEKSMGEFPHIEGLGCAYRGENGKMCAVGCLIKDEFYDPSFENETVESDSVISALEQSLGREITLEEVSLLEELQGVHDKSDPKYWIHGLTTWAQNYGLEMPTT
ncbi:hypothetical protein [Xanthomonas phage BUDD]|nr:hypothetical protein [Xanthomonas phage BUDD]